MEKERDRNEIAMTWKIREKKVGNVMKSMDVWKGKKSKNREYKRMEERGRQSEKKKIEEERDK